MSAPLTALDINRLSEGDTVFVKFSNLPELYYSKLNSLTILRLPENIQYSKYELNERDRHSLFQYKSPTRFIFTRHETGLNKNSAFLR
jgi:hypothetical protein